MRRTLVGLLVVGVGLLAACSSDGSAKSSGSSASTTSPPSTTNAGATTTTIAGTSALEGPIWSLVSMGRTKTPAGVEVTARFEDGKVSGSSGCNTYSASYTVDGSQLKIGAGAATQMACPKGMAIENAYLAALPKVQSYETTDSGSLVLSTPGPVLTYVEERQDVVGSWNVTGYLTSDAQAFTSVLAGTTVTARFDTTGRVSGSSGCNSYGGTYTVTGSAISIQELGSTLKGCVEPDGIQEQERDFQAALQNAKTFTVTGTTLTLFDGQHRRAVTMTRAPTS